MFKRDCYVWMWNLHFHSKEMLIRSTLDPYTFKSIKVNMRLKKISDFSKNSTKVFFI